MAEQGIIQVEIHSANAAIVSLSGEHDLESQARVTAALTAGACPTVLADLWLHVRRLVRDRGAAARGVGVARAGGALELVVARERADPQDAETMGIATLLPVYDSRAAALWTSRAGQQYVLDQ